MASLRSQIPQVRARWEALLHAEPVTTPLAYPDALVHLLDWTLEAIFRELVTTAARRRTGRRPAMTDYRPDCPCGRNPLLTYFVAGEQAMREALVLAQASSLHIDPVERDAALDDLNLAIRHIARREIEAFCGVCQFRHQPEALPHHGDSSGCPASLSTLIETHHAAK